MSHVLAADPVTRITRKMHYSDHDDTAVFYAEQDVTEIQEGNKALYNSFRGAWERHAECGDLYGRIPAIVVGDLMRKGIFLDDAKFLAWLDDRDNSDWRTRPGRLSGRRVVRS